MTDDRNLLERAASMTKMIRDEPVTINQIADDFALYGLDKRATALDNLDAELGGEIDSGSGSLRRHVRLMALRRKMASIHRALRKANR